MSYLPLKTINTEFSNSSNLDAFSRLRTSEPQTLFESQLQYDDKPQLWETNITGNGTKVHLDNESSSLLSVTGTGDSVIRQTYEYFRYQPGKSTFIAITGVFGNYNATVDKRLGYFDDDDGIFFQMTDELSVGIRSSTSGTPVDTVIPQSSWNIDKLDGTGKSKYNIDFTKANIFLVDLQWLGVGRVRFGISHEGNIIYFHEQVHSSSLDTVYMKTATLPCRYEITSNGGSGQLKQICTTVISEGGFKQQGYIRTIDTGSTAIDVGTTSETVLSIRLNPDNPRATLYPKYVSVFQTSNNSVVRYRVVMRHALDNAVIWNDVDDESMVQYSNSQTTVTGGTVIESGYLQPRTQGVLQQAFQEVLPLSSNRAGEPFVLSLVCECIGGTAPVYASIQFREIY